MNQTSPCSCNLAPAASAASTPPKVAVVAASWHSDIVSASTAAIWAEFERRSLPSECLELHRVPGAFEIPLHAMRLARSHRCDALIACGFVVNGGIYRHEFVASAVIDGLMRVQLDSNVPIFSAVLTPWEFHEHDEHQQFFRRHFIKKGTEVAQACLATLEILTALPVAA